MKCKLTRSDVERLGNIVVIPYGTALYNRLSDNCYCHGYNSGVYGWNYDVFVVGAYTVVSGYRPLAKWIKQGGLDFAKCQTIANVADSIYSEHKNDITPYESIVIALTEYLERTPIQAEIFG